MIEGEGFTVNSEEKWEFFIPWARRFFDEHKYVTWAKPRIGPDRSIDQNSLFHVWATEYAAFLLKKGKKKITKGELQGMKRVIKQGFFKETRNTWMVHTVINPKTGETKTDFTSSADYTHDQMYEFLSWLQGHAASEDGLALESKGKFAKEQRKKLDGGGFKEETKEQQKEMVE